MIALDNIHKMLSKARFQKYLMAANNDVSKAVELYRWNTKLASGFYAQLSYFEILVRNAIDSALKDWNQQRTGFYDWALEHQTDDIIYSIIRTPLRSARKHARRELAISRRALNHDDVIAQLNFGNWVALFGESLHEHRSSSKELWQMCLYKAFPRIDDSDVSREKLGKRLDRLRKLRNRVAHQENLLETNVNARINDMLSVLNAIDIGYVGWVLQDSQLRKIVREDPRKC